MNRILIYILGLVFPIVGFGQAVQHSDIKESFSTPRWYSPDGLQYLPTSITEFKGYNGDYTMAHVYEYDFDAGYSGPYLYKFHPLEHNGVVKSIVCREYTVKTSFGEDHWVPRSGFIWKNEYDINNKLVNADWGIQALGNNNFISVGLHKAINNEDILFVSDIFPNGTTQSNDLLKLEYLWNKDGKVDQVQAYYREQGFEDMFAIFKYEYDGSHIKSLKIYDRDGKRTHTIQFTYTPNLLLKSILFYIGTDSTPRVSKFYEYDQNKNLTSYIFLSQEAPIYNKSQIDVKFNNTYDAKQHLIKVDITRTYRLNFEKKASQTWTRIYKYDSHNNWVRMEEGDIAFSREFVY